MTGSMEPDNPLSTMRMKALNPIHIKALNKRIGTIQPDRRYGMII